MGEVLRGKSLSCADAGVGGGIKELVKHVGGSADLWGALVETVPELAESSAFGSDLSKLYDSHPGFRMWLLGEFALNTPTAMIRDKLVAIRDDQEESGQSRWPQLNKGLLDATKHDLRHEWEPIRQNITARIQTIGVANKNKRVTALVVLAEQLQELMYDERSKTGQLYLHKDYLSVLDQIAKEMGDLGSPTDELAIGLMELATDLAKRIKVSGSGLQTREDEDDYDYDQEPETIEGQFTEL